MLVLDGQAQERWRQGRSRETAIERRQRDLKEHIRSNTVTVEDDAGHDVTDLLAQMGRPLTRQQVIQRLRKCNGDFVFEESKADPSKWGVYVWQDARSITGTWERVKQFICGMEAGIMPEFSVRHKRKMKVPNSDLFNNPNPTREVEWNEIETFADETRGWRCVLARLLHARLINEADVQRYFGWAPSRSSKKWQEQTT